MLSFFFFKGPLPLFFITLFEEKLHPARQFWRMFWHSGSFSSQEWHGELHWKTSYQKQLVRLVPWGYACKSQNDVAIYSNVWHSIRWRDFASVQLKVVGEICVACQDKHFVTLALWFLGAILFESTLSLNGRTCSSMHSFSSIGIALKLSCSDESRGCTLNSLS